MKKVNKDKVNISYHVGINWTELRTPKYMKKEYNFNFKGIGWYFNGNDAMLVLPLTFIPNGKIPKGAYQFICYAGDPRPAFQNMLDLPVIEAKKTVWK